MVHADSSNFKADVTKEEAYKQVLEQAELLLDGQRNWVWYALSCFVSESRGYKESNTANLTSLLWHAYKSLPSPSRDVNWAGFYVLDHLAKEQLILGPFQGKVACQTIKFGRGVCGTAAAKKETMLVEDVEEFPGHIACDGDSRSEIVVPIIVDGKTVAIIDVDCAVVNGFDAVDKSALEDLAALIGKACDW
ncbi:related to Free methionine-R-sulfoxide reductase [Phialocephala subalpina]|uniref:Related to Free methionine-R-sulfoxide reductase n=1 Tax=Phialocephala subalpina TaxID=576137 RepID=A0A1L7WKN9_9HELO|nr:related to Free methionine-R-sulfoxide reductase [Phialocephala subalpina]